MSFFDLILGIEFINKEIHMRKLVSVFLFSLSIVVSAAATEVDFSESKLSFTEMFNLYELNCMVNLGSQVSQENRERTILAGFLIDQRSQANLHFKHEKAFAKGCDRGALDKLVDDSFMAFNHAQAKVTITLRTAKNPRLFRGKCMRNIQEQVEIDFQQGTVLKTSLLGKLIDATGC
jgi:hypothetical protein